MQPEIMRQSSLKKNIAAHELAGGQGCKRDHVLTAEAQDELVYFSQRVGSTDFKLQRRHVIHPHGRTRAFWDSVLLFLITWVLVVVPFELSFLELSARIRRDLLRFDLCVDCMFAVDIVLNFNTAIERDGKLHFSFRSIYRQYVRGWFVFDVLWTFPFYALFDQSALHPDLSASPPMAAEHSDLYNFFRMLRLLRVAELPHVRRRLEYSLLISCMFAYLAFGDHEHLAVAVESGQLENADLRSKYIASFYWSMMTMTTVGYGDITVRTNTGRVFALAAMVVGGGIFAYGITNVVALFQQLYVEESQHRLLMDQVNSFMHSRALPRKLRDEIRANFFHMHKAARASKVLDDGIFRQMSRTLQANVATIFCQEVMPHAFPFLAGCNAEFIHELYLSMAVRCYLPGEDIIRQGDYGSEMYFLSVGHVQVFLNHTKVAALGPSAFFGEYGIFNPVKPRLATIQAMDFSETHCIERHDVFRILVGHPFMLRSIKCLAELRSRKALAIMYESGGKSRTLLQGLASMWHQEGILGMLPRSMASEHLPSLLEYLPTEPPVSAATMRRASLHSARVTATPATLGKWMSSSDSLGESGHLVQPDTSSSPPADPRVDVLLAQLQDVAKRQELLDDQMQDILTLLLEAQSHRGLDRFREQHQRSVAMPPLGRDRSQYFHRSVGIPEERESTRGL
ncbi:hypothetical protein PybrP1_002665 [[Pythium] brassicae (nom. inval.)]|nr:hypothetical protein PybrP1_002665 [[Pythium] brassicae (nom. inval.)]